VIYCNLQNILYIHYNYSFICYSEISFPICNMDSFNSGMLTWTTLTSTHSDKHTLWQAHTLTSAHSDKRTLWQAHTLTSAHSDKRTLWQVHTLTSTHSDKHTLWQAHTVTSAHSVKLKLLPHLWNAHSHNSDILTFTTDMLALRTLTCSLAKLWLVSAPVPFWDHFYYSGS